MKRTVPPPQPRRNQPSDPPAPNAGVERWTLVLLAVGGLFWVLVGNGRGIGWVRWAIILAAGGVAFIPAVARPLSRRFSGREDVSHQRVRWTALALWIIASLYFITTAVLQDRDLFPKTHDDSSYWLGVQMLARGRLWMPGLPLPEFFDSFYILTRPVYCSIYFPGTALMFVATAWLHLPTWVMPVIASGAAVALLYLVLVELVDSSAAMLGALLMISLSWFRTYTILLMSQVPVLLLGLGVVYAWLRWRKHRRLGWMALLGVAAGWAAITRPVDALCFVLPAGFAVLLDLRKSPRPWIPIAVGFGGAIPFLCVQAVFDVGVTGSVLHTPYTTYLDRDQPGTGFGLRRFDPELRPQSDLPQKQAYYDWCRTYLVRHQPGDFLGPWVNPQQISPGVTRPAYLTMIADATAPARLLILLVPIGLMLLRDRRRAVLICTIPLFLGLYLLNPFFLEHYALPLAPAFILLILLGWRALPSVWPSWSESIRSAVGVMIVVAAVTNLWELNHWIAPAGQQVDDETFRSPVLRTINVDLPAASDLRRPAVILVRWHPGDNFFEEAVYNSDVPWPDEASIVRAHDLGVERDRKIVAYYAAHQPERTFYLFDARASSPIVELGRANHPDEVITKLAATHR